MLTALTRSRSIILVTFKEKHLGSSQYSTSASYTAFTLPKQRCRYLHMKPRFMQTSFSTFSLYQRRKSTFRLRTGTPQHSLSKVINLVGCKETLQSVISLKVPRKILQCTVAQSVVYNWAENSHKF